MNYRPRPRSSRSQRRTSNFIVLAVAAVLITIGGFAMKNEIQSQKQDVQVAKNNTDYYSSPDDASQETPINGVPQERLDAYERAGAKATPAPTKKPAATEKPKATPQPSSTPSTKPSSKPNNQAGADTASYRVTVYEGIIGVFLDGEDTPVLTLDVPVDSLPNEDVTLLKAGIVLDNMGAVKSFLEDYE